MPAKSLDELSADGLIDPGWAHALAPVGPRIAELGAFLRAETVAGHGYLPRGEHVLRAFGAPLDDVRVLIVGQDPYPTPGASDRPVLRGRPPTCGPCRGASRTSTGSSPTTSASTPPGHGDLTPWSASGVMLLNRVLTVRPGAPGVAPRQGLGDA